jgi:hypothetical protein
VQLFRVDVVSVFVGVGTGDVNVGIRDVVVLVVAVGEDDGGFVGVAHVTDAFGDKIETSLGVIGGGDAADDIVSEFILLIGGAAVGSWKGLDTTQ